MPTLTATFEEAQADLFGAGMLRRAAKLVEAEEAALQKAARTATDVTRRSFRYHRDIVPPRPGRSSSGGQMASHLRWGVTKGGQVAFDVARADREVPHWIIQEIGTGQRATVGMGAGRPVKVRSVKKQAGRRISSGLVFARGGRYSPPNSSTGEQLFRASDIKDAPRGMAHGRFGGLRIRNEIHGQHFVQAGGIAGFQQFKKEMLLAARQAFGKRNSP